MLGISSFATVAVRAAEAAPKTAEVASAQQAAPETEKAEEEHHGLPQNAPVLGGKYLQVTSSMVWTWIIALGIIIFARYATRQIKEVPEGAQNFWEWLVESLRDFLESIIGRELVKKTFWFFATLFIFILFANWAGLIPGVGTIGWGIPDAQGGLHHISKPLFRGVNADLNMTLGMSLLFFVLWIIWAFQANGFGGMIMHIFGPKGEMKSFWGKAGMVVIFAIVGVLELISIAFRPVSLSFRLYGNIFAGENILESMSNIVPGLSWLIPVPFYFMELLVGIAQALVFMLLTAVFTMLICQHEEDHH
ncbi:ATP synthase F0, A subunit [Chthoniobacter flavus Ellin428]|uniref:ATP synthase subunit a n=2 Tax=Chthoniobacter flavus TaxID=191863 RepID=B4D6F5_9BACT|nr:ATP synthase F0, A subunit [Chthoniobacter flavus Ellin428]TCO88305.1 F-type H+-transporting ATPase subunit a [Chthoniobacter flavus]